LNKNSKKPCTWERSEGESRDTGGVWGEDLGESGGGYTFIDRMSWDNFNESGELIEQIENYRQRFGYYPESVHADRIYRSRDNLQYCVRHGIRLSLPRLGRTKRVEDPVERKQMREDE
jgi:IS5 family transposase